MDWEVSTEIFFYDSVHHSSRIFLQNDFSLWYIRAMAKNLHKEAHQLDISKTKRISELTSNENVQFDIFYFSHSGLSKTRVPFRMYMSRKTQATMYLLLWHFSCWWRASEMGWVSEYILKLQNTSQTPNFFPPECSTLRLSIKTFKTFGGKVKKCGESKHWTSNQSVRFPPTPLK